MIICIEFDKEKYTTEHALAMITLFIMSDSKNSNGVTVGNTRITKETSTLVEESYTIEEIK